MLDTQSANQGPLTLRQKLANHPALGRVLAIALVVVGLIALVSRIRGTPNNDVGWTKSAYFTVDDGKSFFADSFQPYPFDYQGKPAYRAAVFKVPGSTPFVAYLERFTEQGKADVTPVLGRESVAAQQQYANLRDSEMEVKKPGAGRWVPAGSREGQAMMNVASPTGNTDVQECYP